METPQWWWEQDDEYTQDQPVPTELAGEAGPNGLALVKAFDDGRTQPGWGLVPRTPKGVGFMANYTKGVFLGRKALASYTSRDRPFAFVMRSARAVCIDIDGKNGGIEHAVELLGNAPVTLAETSRSGTGFHLFYSTAEPWDPDTGFALYDDAISIVTGVDVRATGCVYHHVQQRWNQRPIAPLPQWIAERLASRKHYREQQKGLLTEITSEGADDMEKLMVQDELVTDLRKPIPMGRRNNTLFALGTKMKTAKVPDWQLLVEERAVELGLDHDEATKLVANICHYGV